jgi:hypothetical protein
MQFSHGLDTPSADRFVSMYVNDWTPTKETWDGSSNLAGFEKD